MRLLTALGLASLLIVAAASGCGGPRRGLAAGAPPPPPDLVTLAVGGHSQALWPYFGPDLSGAPSDPVNLLFVGSADPRDIRAALLAVDGDRTAAGYPRSPPFDCRWSDAIGDLLVGYQADVGWAGTAIQLQCGDFRTTRFHLRLAKMGGLTFGGAHFEHLIPGTADHQVLSWEMAEQLVVADLLRSGLLTEAPSQTDSIHRAPFREITPEIYRDLPVALKRLIGGPDSSGSEVPIATDGRATVLTLGATTTAVTTDTAQSFTVDFQRVIPRPFCQSSGSPYLAVSGPIVFRQVVQWERGTFRGTVDIEGEVEVVPVDPTTGKPAGPAFRATVAEHHRTVVSDTAASVEGVLRRDEWPSGGRHGSLLQRLSVGPAVARFDRAERCR